MTLWCVSQFLVQLIRVSSNLKKFNFSSKNLHRDRDLLNSKRSLCVLFIKSKSLPVGDCALNTASLLFAVELQLNWQCKKVGQLYYKLSCNDGCNIIDIIIICGVWKYQPPLRISSESYDFFDKLALRGPEIVTFSTSVNLCRWINI